MKKISIILQVLLLGAFLSCKHTDQNLVNNIQQEADLQRQSANEFSGLQQKIMLVLSEANQAQPETMQNPDFQELVKLASSIEAKAKISNEEFSANSGKLSDLSAAYAEGKISKEEAEKQYESLKTKPDDVKKLITTLNTLIDSAQVKWGKVIPR